MEGIALKVGDEKYQAEAGAIDKSKNVAQVWLYGYPPGISQAQ